MQNYFPGVFPTFWDSFDWAVAEGMVISTREVFAELEKQLTSMFMEQWVRDNRDIFLTPGPDETEFVARMLEIDHFQQMVKRRNIYKGLPVADPFIIAAAACRGGMVVTQEKYVLNAAKIPNVCEHFKIECMDLEGFVEKQGWSF